MTKYLIVAVVWLASLVCVGWWQNDAGHTAERSAWQTRENKELREANTLINVLQTSARDKEAEHAEKLAEIAADREKERKDAKDKRDRDVAAARSGALILRYGAAGQQARSGGIGTSGAGACLGDGRASGQLPGEIAADLLDLVNNADDVARQLSDAQRVILEDRRLCGAAK